MSWRVVDSTGRVVDDPELRWFKLTKLEQQALAKALGPAGFRLERYTREPTVRIGSAPDWARYKNGTGPEPGSDEWRKRASYFSWLHATEDYTQREIEYIKESWTEGRQEDFELWKLLKEKGML